MNDCLLYSNTVLFSVSGGVAKASTNLEQHAYRKFCNKFEDCSSKIEVQRLCLETREERLLSQSHA